MGFFSRTIELINDTSKAIIGRLTALPGVTQAAIARAIKRDSSTISQVERGKKPGANLAADLLKLERELSGAVDPKETIKTIDLEPPERLTRDGERVPVRQSAADREAARKAEAAAVARQGMSVTIRGRLGTSDDFRDRTIEVDFDADEAIEFLTMWDVDREAAYDMIFEEYGAPLSVQRLDGIVFD